MYFLAGTTLNLIKFPILRPNKYHLAKRMERLEEDRLHDAEIKEKRKLKASSKSRDLVLFGK